MLLRTFSLTLLATLFLTVPTYQLAMESNTSKSEIKQNETCSFCLENLEIDSYTLSCGHNGFCNSCLMQILSITDKEKQLNYLRCPESSCKKDLTQQDLKKITDNDNLLAKIAQLKQQASEQTNNLYLTGQSKNCPKCNTTQFSEGCNHTTCTKCSHKFCWECVTPWNNSHKYYQCNTNLNNTTSNSNPSPVDQLTADWLQANTKKCPGCKVNIEKTLYSCIQMTCSQCNTNFCWTCLNPWDFPTPHQNPLKCEMEPTQNNTLDIE